MLNKTSQPSRSRRQFIQTGAAVAATSLAGGYAMAVNTAPKKIRIGIAGGRFGTTFQWHEHPDCVVHAVTDLRSERRDALVKTYRCSNAYNSLEEMVLDKELDAVAIFTDGPLHVRHTELAMKHGKHVIAAVPAAWATLEECEKLKGLVESTGLSYMMAETSYYQQHTISAREFFQRGEFGNLFYCESEYQHDGVEHYAIEEGKRTWRYGVAPMHYPTHCTAHLIGVTGQRLTDVVCHGWGDGHPILKDNPYANPFWNQSAMFGTDQGRAFRVNIWWKGAFGGCERADWIGDRMSFYCHNPLGLGPVRVVKTGQLGKDSGGFATGAPKVEPYEVPRWWQTERLPEPLRHDSGHEGSHTFLTHEFIDALTHGRRPAVDVYEALAYTAPGIVAHQSALKGGERLTIPQYD